MSLTKVSFSMVTGAVTNIQDFGAVGDGVTNNLSTIQAAFAASDFIYVPDGDFLITGGYVGWTSRTKVKIIGPGKLRRSDVGRVLYIDSCTDVTVENLEVQGEGVTYNAQGNAIWLQDCSDFKVIGNRVRNANRMGINIEASPDGTVANNIVTDCWQDGIMVRTASNRVTVTGNVCHNNGDTVFSPPVGEGIHLFDVSDCAVVGNICYDNSDHGIALEGANYCTITGNSTSENTVCGVSINAGPVNSGVGSVVSGNTIKSNTSDGIILTAVDDCVISGNVISGNGRYGINQGIASGPSQDRIITTDNRILDNTSGGIIYDWNNVDCVVTNNVIRGSNGRGILINRAQSVDTVIAGNSIKGFPVAQITDNGTTSRIYDNDVGQKLSGSATLSSGLATITFTANMPMSSYVVALNSTVNETMYTTNKTVSGFEIRSSNGASTATVTWRIVDQKAS